MLKNPVESSFPTGESIQPPRPPPDLDFSHSLYSSTGDASRNDARRQTTALYLEALGHWPGFHICHVGRENGLMFTGRLLAIENNWNNWK